jgi:uncharacterized protein (UPF0147 family)
MPKNIRLMHHTCQIKYLGTQMTTHSRLEQIAQISLGWSVNQSVPVDLRETASYLYQMLVNANESDLVDGSETAKTLDDLFSYLCRQINRCDCRVKQVDEALLNCRL